MEKQTMKPSEEVVEKKPAPKKKKKSKKKVVIQQTPKDQPRVYTPKEKRMGLPWKERRNER